MKNGVLPSLYAGAKPVRAACLTALLMSSALIAGPAWAQEAHGHEHAAHAEDADAHDHDKAHDHGDHGHAHEAASEDGFGFGDEDGEVTTIEAHVHGAASLTATLDGGTLSLILEGAAYNFYGFEREPENEEEAAVVSAAALRLADGASLFAPNRQAECAFQSAALALGVTPEVADHDHGDHDDHGDDHDHDHDHAAHPNVSGTFTFACAQPERLERVEVAVFEAFERLESLSASFISDEVQAAADLTPARNVFDLR